MNITKEELDAIVKALLAVDDYKPIGQSLGGWFPLSNRLWALLNAVPGSSTEMLRQMVLAGFAVPGQQAELFAAFVADLFNALNLMANGAADVVQDTVSGATSVAAGIGAGAAQLREFARDNIKDFDLTGRLGWLGTTLIMIVLITASMYALLIIMVHISINDHIKNARRESERQSGPSRERVSQSPLRRFG